MGKYINIMVKQMPYRYEGAATEMCLSSMYLLYIFQLFSQISGICGLVCPVGVLSLDQPAAGGLLEPCVVAFSAISKSGREPVHLMKIVYNGLEVIEGY